MRLGFVAVAPFRQRLVPKHRRGHRLGNLAIHVAAFLAAALLAGSSLDASASKVQLLMLIAGALLTVFTNKGTPLITAIITGMSIILC